MNNKEHELSQINQKISDAQLFMINYMGFATRLARPRIIC